MIKSRIPKFLEPGDEIRIVAPASRVEKKYIENATKAISRLGYTVSLGENVYADFHQFAGNDTTRVTDLQEALDDPNVKAIFCARGGYGSVRLVDKLNFDGFIKYPKWLVGFSDITVFHSHLNTRLNFASIHSPMPVNAESAYFASNLAQLNKLISGNAEQLSLPACEFNRTGKAEGKLVGGNLSIIYSLQATPFELKTDGSILFIEDVGEQLYHLDRMLNNLKLSDKFKNLKGMIVGAFSDMKDKKRPFGKSVEEIITEFSRDYGYPVLFNFPAGHIENNLPFYLGAEVRLEVHNSGAKIEFLLQT